MSSDRERTSAGLRKLRERSSRFVQQAVGQRRGSNRQRIQLDLSVRPSMVSGMATEKITVTVDKQQLEQVRALVSDGKVPNVSAFVKHAVGIALADVAGWAGLLAEALQQTGGPMTQRERAWADSILAPRETKGKRARKVA